MSKIPYVISVDVDKASLKRIQNKIESELSDIKLGKNDGFLNFDVFEGNIDKYKLFLSELRESLPTLPFDFESTTTKSAIETVKNELFDLGYVLKNEISFDGIQTEFDDLILYMSKNLDGSGKFFTDSPEFKQLIISKYERTMSSLAAGISSGAIKGSEARMLSDQKDIIEKMLMPYKEDIEMAKPVEVIEKITKGMNEDVLNVLSTLELLNEELKTQLELEVDLKKAEDDRKNKNAGNQSSNTKNGLKKNENKVLENEKETSDTVEENAKETSDTISSMSKETIDEIINRVISAINELQDKVISSMKEISNTSAEKLSSSMSDALSKNRIDNWKEYFIEAIKEVSSSLSSFNKFAYIAEQQDNFNKILENLGIEQKKDRTREMAFVASSKTGHTFGDFSAEVGQVLNTKNHEKVIQENNRAISTEFQDALVKAANESMEEVVDTFLHIHPFKKIANISSPGMSSVDESGGDLIAFIYDYFNRGIKNEIVRAGNEIVSFDIGKFVEDNFSHFTTDGELNKNKVDLFKGEFSRLFNERIKIEQAEANANLFGDIQSEFGNNHTILSDLFKEIKYEDTNGVALKLEDTFENITSYVLKTGEADLQSIIREFLEEKVPNISEKNLKLYDSNLNGKNNLRSLMEIFYKNFNLTYKDMDSYGGRNTVLKVLQDIGANYFGNKEFDATNYLKSFKSFDEFKDANPFNWDTNAWNTFFGEAEGQTNSLATNIINIINSIDKFNEVAEKLSSAFDLSGITSDLNYIRKFFEELKENVGVINTLSESFKEASENKEKLVNENNSPVVQGQEENSKEANALEQKAKAQEHVNETEAAEPNKGEVSSNNILQQNSQVEEKKEERTVPVSSKVYSEKEFLKSYEYIQRLKNALFQVIDLSKSTGNTLEDTKSYASKKSILSNYPILKGLNGQFESKEAAELFMKSNDWIELLEQDENTKYALNTEIFPEDLNQEYEAIKAIQEYKKNVDLTNISMEELDKLFDKFMSFDNISTTQNGGNTLDKIEDIITELDMAKSDKLKGYIDEFNNLDLKNASISEIDKFISLFSSLDTYGINQNESEQFDTQIDNILNKLEEAKEKLKDSSASESVDEIKGKIKEAVESGKMSEEAGEKKLNDLTKTSKITTISLNDLFDALSNVKENVFSLGDSGTGLFSVQNPVENLSTEYIKNLVGRYSSIDTIIQKKTSDFATFSPDELQNALEESYSGITNQYIKSLNGVVGIDFNKLSREQWALIIDKYREFYSKLMKQENVSNSDLKNGGSIASEFQKKAYSLLKNIINRMIPDESSSPLTYTSNTNFRKKYASFYNTGENVPEEIKTVKPKERKKNTTSSQKNKTEKETTKTESKTEEAEVKEKTISDTIDEFVDSVDVTKMSLEELKSKLDEFNKFMGEIGIENIPSEKIPILRNLSDSINASIDKKTDPKKRQIASKASQQLKNAKNVKANSEEDEISTYTKVINDLTNKIKSIRASVDTEDNGIISNLLFGKDGTIKSEEQMLEEIKSEAKDIISSVYSENKNATNEDFISSLSNVLKKYNAAQSFGIVGYGKLDDCVESLYKESNIHVTENLSDDYMAQMGQAVESQKRLDSIKEIGEKQYLSLLEEEEALNSEISNIRAKNILGRKHPSPNPNEDNISEEEADHNIAVLNEEYSSIASLIEKIEVFQDKSKNLFSDFDARYILRDLEIFKDDVEKDIEVLKIFKLNLKNNAVDIFDKAYFKKLKGAPTELLSIYDDIEDEIYDSKIKTGEEAITKFEDKIKELGFVWNEESKQFEKSNIPVITSETAENTKENAEEIISSEEEIFDINKYLNSGELNNVDSAGINAYLEKVKSNEKETYDETTALFNAFKTLLQIRSGSYDEFVSSISNANTPASAMLGAMSNMPINNIANRKAAFNSLGNDAIDGYYNGIAEKIKEVEEIVTKVIDSGLDAAAKAQDSHSPSEKYKQLGIDAMNGYIEGVKSKQADVENAVSEVISGAYENTNNENTKSLNVKISPTFNVNEFLNEIQNKLKEAEPVKVNVNPKVESKNNSSDDDKTDKEATKTKALSDAYDYLIKNTNKYYAAKNKIKNEKSTTISEDSLIKQYEEQLEYIDKSSEKIKEKQEELNEVTKSASAYNDSSNLTKLQELSDSLKSMSNSSKYTNEFRLQLKALYDEFEEASDVDKLSNFEEFISKYNNMIELSKDKGNLQGSANKLRSFMTTLAKLQSYTGLPKELQENIKNLSNEIKGLIDSGDFSKLDLADVTGKVLTLQTQVESSGKKTVSFLDQVKQRLRDMNSKYIAQFFSFYDWIRYLREAFSIIEEIDSALTELRKVSNATETELNKALDSAVKTSKELGANIEDIVSIQADWSRLGYSLSDSKDLAYQTQLLVNVGDNLDADSASEYLISTLKGFDLTADQAGSIVDKYNEVANNFAIDTEGIGEALENSASSFYAANTDLSQAIAILTTSNAVVQDPSSVGTTFKTLSARIRGASTELEDLGEEEDEYTETTSKLRDLVMSLTGFDIMEDANTYKSIYDILIGIGKEWNNLSDIEQASLGEALAGKRNANALYAVLNNIDDLEEAYETAENAAGSAEKEQENYAKSIEYSINSIKASAEDWINSLISSDVIKWFIDLGNSLVKISNTMGQWPTIFAAISGFAIFKNWGNIKDTSEQLQNATIALNSINDAYENIRDYNLTNEGLFKDSSFADGNAVLDEYINKLNGLSNTTAIAVIKSSNLTDAQKEQLMMAISLKDQTNELSDAKINEVLTSKLGANAYKEEIASEISLAAATGQLNKEKIEEILDESESIVLKNMDANARKNLADSIYKEIIAEKSDSDAKKINSDITKKLIFEKNAESFSATKIAIQNALEGLSYENLATTIDTATASTITFLATNPIGWIMALVTAIRLVTAAYDKFHVSIEDITEASEGFIESVEDLQSNVSSNSETLEELNDEYQKLSKGVSETGQNISLTEKQYSEYKSTISSISEIMPNLTNYFNSQGEAIGFTEGKIKDLNKAYDEYLKNQAKDILSNGNENGNTLNDVLTDYKSNISATAGIIDELLVGLKSIAEIATSDDIVTSEVYDAYEQLLNVDKDDFFKTYEKMPVVLKSAFNNDFNTNPIDVMKMSDEEYNQLKNDISVKLSDLESDMEADASKLASSMVTIAYADYGNEFYDATDEAQDNIITFLSGLNSEELSIFGVDGETTESELKSITENIVDAFADDENDINEAWNEMLKLDTSNLSPEEYAEKINDFVDKVAKILQVDASTDENRDLILSMFGLTSNSDIEAIRTQVAEEYGEDFANGLDIYQLEYINDNSDKFENVVESEKIALGKENLSLEEMNSLLIQLIKNKSNLTNTELISDATNSLEELDDLDSVYQDIRDKGNFDLASLTDTDGNFYEEFGGFTEEYRNFIETVSSSPEDLSACQGAFDNLLTSWMMSKDVLGDLNEDTMQSVANMMNQKGISNTESLVKNYMLAAQEYSNYAESVDDARIKTLDLADATATEIKALMEESSATEDAKNYWIAYYMEKFIAGLDFTTDESIQELANEIEALGIAGTAWGNYYAAKANLSRLSNANVGDSVDLIYAGSGVDSDKDGEVDTFSRTKSNMSQNEIDYWTKYYQKVLSKSTSDASADINGTLNKLTANYIGDLQEAKDAAQEAQEKYADILDAAIDHLDAQLDANQITFEDYLNKRLDLINNFYDNGLISAQKYYEELEDYYQAQIDGYDQVVDAVNKVIDDQVDSLNDQKEAIEKYYNDQIDSLNDELDALEDANDARQEAIDLQKAQYELERAQNQRTKLVKLCQAS